MLYQPINRHFISKFNFLSYISSSWSLFRIKNFNNTHNKIGKMMAINKPVLSPTSEKSLLLNKRSKNVFSPLVIFEETTPTILAIAH